MTTRTPIDPELLWQVLLGLVGEHAAEEVMAAVVAAERVEVVLYRDPDGRGADGVDVQVFLGGTPVEARLFVVDPGAGYTTSVWDTNRDVAVREASPAAAAVIRSFYATGAQTEFIEDDRGAYHDG